MMSHPQPIDIQGRFALRFDFMTKSLTLKILVNGPDGTMWEAVIPFTEREPAPIQYHEGVK